MVKCTFCGTTIETGTGIMYVLKDGKVLRFDSKKCEKAMLHRNKKARNTRWTEEHHNLKKGVKQ